jgi:hypothetical protein
VTEKWLEECSQNHIRCSSGDCNFDAFARGCMTEQPLSDRNSSSINGSFQLRIEKTQTSLLNKILYIAGLVVTCWNSSPPGVSKTLIVGFKLNRLQLCKNKQNISLALRVCYVVRDKQPAIRSTWKSQSLPPIPLPNEHYSI